MQQVAPTALTGRNLEEAIALAERARDFIAGGVPAVDGEPDPVARLKVTAELSRLTTRLIHLICWLSLERSVNAGETSWQEALDGWTPLSDVAVCLDDAAESEAAIHPYLRDLLGDSRELYQRVARLDAFTRADAPRGPQLPVIDF